MLRKGLLFASATLSGLAAGIAAHAAPAVNLLAIESSGAPAVKVDYYYPGDDYGVPPYYGRGFADVPRDVIGGTLGLIGGAIGGALQGPNDYAPPYYGPGYGEPYYPSYSEQYYYGERPEPACAPGSPYFDPASGACIADGEEELPYPER